MIVAYKVLIQSAYIFFVKLTIRCVENTEVFASNEALTHLPAELLVLHAQPLLLGVSPHHHLLQHPVVLHQPRLQVCLAGQLRPQVLNLIENKNTFKYWPLFKTF